MRVAAACVAVVTAAGLTVAVSAPAQALALSAALVGPRPNATRVDFPVGDRVAASVDVGTGNLLVTTTELSVPGIGSDVQFGMVFNSLLLAPGSPLPAGGGGYGWATRLGQDTKLVANSDGTVLYFAPGGTQGTYVPTSSGASTYTTPAGFKNTLVKTGTGWSLTDHGTGSVTVFTTSGRLTSVTDRNGQVTSLNRYGFSAALILAAPRG